jgi:hypothetical protein
MTEEREEDKGVTRRAALRAAGGVVAASSAVLVGSLFGAGAAPKAEAGDRSQAIVGSWINPHTRNGGVSIATFAADGGWTNVHPNRRRSPAHGRWEHKDDGSFHVTRWSLRFNESDQLIGAMRTRAAAVVDSDGQGLTSRRISEFFDLAGKLLGASEVVESRAIRINAESPP